jgi:hypothetical protein
MTRRLIIWTHIGIGVLANVTILIMSVAVDSRTGGEVGERTELVVDTSAGRITRFADSSLARRLRGLVRFTLTGAEGVLAGQVVAAVAFAGGVLLVWTGLSLALGRLSAWVREAPTSKRQQTSPMPSPGRIASWSTAAALNARELKRLGWHRLVFR